MIHPTSINADTYAHDGPVNNRVGLSNVIAHAPTEGCNNATAKKTQENWHRQINTRNTLSTGKVHNDEKLDTLTRSKNPRTLNKDAT